LGQPCKARHLKPCRSADDDEFARLARGDSLSCFPSCPRLSASLADRRRGESPGYSTTGLEVYRTNSRQIAGVCRARDSRRRPSVRPAYEAQNSGAALRRDRPRTTPERVLQHEWLKRPRRDRPVSRETRSRFVSSDVQEFPQVDLAICAATVAVLRALVAERWSPLALQPGCGPSSHWPRYF